MQIIGFKWKGNGMHSWTPHLVMDSNGEVERLPISDKIDIKLGERFCTGYTINGRYSRCPNHAKISSGWRCEQCKKTDDFSFCIQCSGDCLNERQRELCKSSSYYIYLAAFDSTVKVGISHERRFFERLIEQGADFAARIAFMQDGMVVRKAEQTIKRTLNCTDRMRGHEKNERLLGDPNASVLQISKALAVLKDKFDINMLEVYDLRKFYGLEHVKKKPRMIRVRDGLRIAGDVVAAKGNIIVIKNGYFYSLNMHDIIGREVEINLN
ncbi:MAG: DUF2797 domain-containing protein [Candidatus Aenigmarchaeota archaeon]|nr:DUF2797 domain-containing protein [Candidatus Aenigmarchaeota archaeon]